MSRFKDLSGQKFNMLTAIRFLEIRNKNAYWECRCDCGNLHVIAGADLKRGQTKSCGCARQQLQAASKFKDLTGQLFGRLKVLRLSHITEKYRVSIYECQCECGTIKTVDRSSLIRGHTVSCGCYNRDKQLLGAGISSLHNYLNSYKQSARKRGYIFELTEEQFKSIIARDCASCGAPPISISRKYKNTASTPILANGIDRKNNSLGYIMENVQPMCTPCNKAKTNMGEKAFNEWRQRLKNS